MRIVLDKMVLCDHGRESAADLRIEAVRSVQVDEGVRAEQVSTRDRMNRQTSMSFTTSREHASLAAAFTFTVEHAEAVLGRSGVLEVETLQTTGAPSVRFMRRALVTTVRVAQVGVRTFASYQIIGGKLSKKRQD